MFGGKKDGDKPAEKKPAEKKPAPADGEKQNPLSGTIGKLGGMFKRSKDGDKPAEAKERPTNKPTDEGNAEKKGGRIRLLPINIPFGRKKMPTAGELLAESTTPPAEQAPAARRGVFNKKTVDAAAREAKAARPNVFTRFSNFLRPPADAPRPPQRPRTSRAPVVESEGGLTLDNWLDIIGVSLLGGAGLLTLSALSGEQAAIRGVLRFLGELLGWGAFIVPLTMAIIGMWLIVRHFGDTAPSVDPVRVVGVVIGILAALVAMQYIDSLSYPPITTPELLALRLMYSWQELHAGGGAIGAELYLFLIRNFTELGGLVVVGLLFVVSIMLATRSSASQMLAAAIGVGRSLREAIQRRAAAQRARRQLEMERRAAERAAAEERARAAAEQAKAAAPAAVVESPGIRINFGTDAPSPVPAAVAPVVVAAPPAPPETGRRFSLGSGSLLGRFRRAATQEPAPPPLIEPLPLDDTPPLTTSVAYAGATIPPDDLPPAQPPSAYIPFEPPAASTAPASPASPPVGSEMAARSDRINALRNGHTALPTLAAPASPPPRVGPDTSLPPSQLPSVQPAPGPHQPMLSVPFSSPVVNQTRAQRPVWRKPDYRTLLSSGSEQEFDRELLLRQAKIIEDTLSSFGAPGRVVEVNTGPVITQFGVEPDYVSARGKKQRVKVGAIAALDKDLQLALGAKSIRVEAPVPGKGYVGIEVPNKEPATVRLRDVMESPGFNKIKSPLAIALGQSVSGAPVSADLVSMPHVLIAGTTGSGKSVMVNAIICSIIARHTPDTVKFIMVDPKRVELIGYNGIPHLVAPVVVELERIVGVLKWVTREMDDRYKRFSDAAARNIEDYNKNLSGDRDPMPYIVVIIDELADLMMQAPDETERAITRIAALARATGIHLVIATQRPSVDVVTGLIRANFPARIAFAVASGVDSRVILDQPGAEKLLGRGDMLYLSGDSPAPVRLQGVFVSDLEINNLVRFWKMQAIDQPEQKPFSTSVAPESIRAMNPATITAPATYSPPPASAPAPAAPSFWDTPAAPARTGAELPASALTGDSGDDDLYEQAVELVRRLEKASVSLLQRRLRIGYTRAARLIDMMEARGVVGPAKDGSSKPRDVLPLSKEKPKA